MGGCGDALRATRCSPRCRRSEHPHVRSVLVRHGEITSSSPRSMDMSDTRAGVLIRAGTTSHEWPQPMHQHADGPRAVMSPQQRRTNDLCALLGETLVDEHDVEQHGLAWWYPQLKHWPTVRSVGAGRGG